MIQRTLRGVEALRESLGRARTDGARLGALALGGAACTSPAAARWCEPAARILAAPWNPAAAVASYEQQRAPRHPSALGIGAVVASQAVYVSRLLTLGARPSWPVAAVCAAATAGGVAYARRTPLTPAALAGGLALSVTTALANNPALRGGAVAREGISHGANLAFAAEGLRLLANSQPRSGFLAALTSAAAGVGQLLLADGLRH